MVTNACIFCQIAAGKIPSTKVYEDDHILAFLDIAPATAGHTLVISKEHYDNFLSAPKEAMNRVMNVAQRIGQAQIKMLDARGVNILTNNYAAAGQTVLHFHVHVIPRFSPDDRLKIEMLKGDQSSKADLPMIASKITKGIKS